METMLRNLLPCFWLFFLLFLCFIIMLMPLSFSMNDHPLTVQYNKSLYAFGRAGRQSLRILANRLTQFKG